VEDRDPWMVVRWGMRVVSNFLGHPSPTVSTRPPPSREIQTVAPLTVAGRINIGESKTVRNDIPIQWRL